MQKSGNILTALAFALLISNACTHENLPVPSDGNELGGIKADICATTKAPKEEKYSDESGRLQFQDGDQVVITTMRRTNKPLSNYSYKDLQYVCTDGALDRLDDKGKVYWSDNSQGHTFIGYSLPQGYDTDKWTLVENAFYDGNMSYTTNDDKNLVDFSDPDTFAKEDVVLSYATDITPDASGYFAMLNFYHGLSRVRVVVNIKGFASESGVVDTRTLVSNMIMTDQKIKYRWTQENACLIAPNDNITADIKMWCEDEKGNGSDDSKTFVFYGYAVPGKQIPAFNFNVTYPDATKPGSTVSFNYTAAMAKNVEFKSGYCTQIEINLNHKNEKIIIGASFTDWETAKFPDQGNLVKRDSFIHASDNSLIKLHGAVDDKYSATWLYSDEEGNVLDSEGHSGDSREDAYRISSGLQLQSFAAEVGGGFSFQDKWVILATDIFMQEKEYSSNYNWPGIGDGTPEHCFQGHFLGQGRFIRRLKGSPLFNTIGSNAVIDRLCIETLSDYSTVAGVLKYEANGLEGGTLALVNDGIICGCEVNGYVSGETSVMGLVQENRDGYILASHHIGMTEAELFEGYYADPEDDTDAYVASFHFCSENVTGSNILASDLNDEISVWNSRYGNDGTVGFKWNIDYFYADNIGSHPEID